MQEYCSQYARRDDERPLKVSRFLEALTVSQNFILILIFLKINTIRPIHEGMHCNTPKRPHYKPSHFKIYCMFQSQIRTSKVQMEQTDIYPNILSCDL